MPDLYRALNVSTGRENDCPVGAEREHSVTSFEYLGFLLAPALDILEQATEEVSQNGVPAEVEIAIWKSRHDFIAYSQSSCPMLSGVTRLS